MDNNSVSNQRLIGLTVVVGLIVLLTAFVWMILSRAGKVVVEFVTMPTDSVIAIDDRSIGHNTHLAPGVYEVTVSREGFDSVTKSIEVHNRADTVIGIALTENSETGRQYLKDNPDELTVLDGIGGIESRNSTAKLQESIPAISKLPRIDPEGLYAINYGPKDDGVFLLIGNSATIGRQEAINWLKKEGVDINTTDIRYDDYISPLKNRSLSERMY